MKKIEKYIYLVIVFILVVVIASGITYIVVKDKEVKTNENNNQNENNNKAPEKITLSNSELEEYLKYVPRDMMNEKQNVYFTPSNIDKLNITTLIGSTINYATYFTNLGIQSETYED